MGRLIAIFVITRAALFLATLAPWPQDCRSYESPSPEDPSTTIVKRPNWGPRPDAPSEGARGRLWQWSADHPTLDAFARWDASFYFSIAVAGYEPQPGESELPLRCGFLPGYAFLVRGVAAATNFVTGGSLELPPPERVWVGLLAAVLVSNGAFLLSLIVLRRLAHALTEDAALADRVVVAAAVAPTSFFFSAALSESVFFALSTASLLFAFRRRFLFAALCAAAAAFTRPVGLFLVFPLLAAAWERRADAKQTARDALLLSLVPLGFVGALAFSAAATGKWNAYFEAQAAFGHEEFPTLDGLRHLLKSTGKTPEALTRDLLQALSILVAAALTVPLVKAARGRKFFWVLASWVFVSIAFPLLSDDLVSMPRYVAAAAPVYIGAAMFCRRPIVARSVAVASLLGQVAGFLAFSRSWPILV
jgi:hypothetical protein